MSRYTMAKRGFRFVLTAYGFDQTPVRARFQRTVDKSVGDYIYKVPTSWVERGYVKEVADNG